MSEEVLGRKPLYFINGRWYQIIDHCRGLLDVDWLYHMSAFVFVFNDGAYVGKKGILPKRKFSGLKDICNYLNELMITDYPMAYTPYVHQIHSITDVAKFVDMSYLKVQNGQD